MGWVLSILAVLVMGGALGLLVVTLRRVQPDWVPPRSRPEIGTTVVARVLPSGEPVSESFARVLRTRTPAAVEVKQLGTPDK